MLTITVLGTPAPQGSKSFKGMSKSGHAILTESSSKVKPWRESVKWAAREAPQRLSCAQGPVGIEVTFTLPKPKSAPKTRQTFPDRKPDIDKLVRSTLDALVAAGTIEDDARVLALLAKKVYPGEGQDALDVPGAVIRVSRIQVGQSARGRG